MSNMWRKFAKSKKYREAFVASHFKRSIPFQITALLKKRGWSQEKLAKEAGLTQGVISRAANPNYGNLTFNTILRIAAGLDVAFVGEFVPFSELAKRVENLSEELALPTFEEENEALRSHMKSEQEQINAIHDNAAISDRVTIDVIHGSAKESISDRSNVQQSQRLAPGLGSWKTLRTTGALGSQERTESQKAA